MQEYESQLLVQRQFVQKAESRWDGLRGDCALMLTDIFGSIENHPEIRLAVDLLSPDQATFQKAVRKLWRKDFANSYEMEAISLIVLRNVHSEHLIPLLNPRQRLFAGLSFWENIQKALIRSKEQPDLPLFALQFLNARPDLVAQAPLTVENQIANLVLGDSRQLRRIADEGERSAYRLGRRVDRLWHDMHDYDSSTSYSSRMRIRGVEIEKNRADRKRENRILNASLAEERDEFLRLREAISGR